jgi:hypothetical protein
MQQWQLERRRNRWLVALACLTAGFAAGALFVVLRG